MSETRHHIIKVLLLLLWCCWLLQTGADTQKWHVIGSLDDIEGKKTLGGERKAGSKMHCAMMASVNPSANVFCFTTQNVCTMYAYKVFTTNNTSTNDGQKTCYRRCFHGES